MAGELPILTAANPSQRGDWSPNRHGAVLNITNIVRLYRVC